MRLRCLGFTSQLRRYYGWLIFIEKGPTLLSAEALKREAEKKECDRCASEKGSNNGTNHSGLPDFQTSDVLYTLDGRTNSLVDTASYLRAQNQANGNDSQHLYQQEGAATSFNNSTLDSNKNFESNGDSNGHHKAHIS